MENRASYLLIGTFVLLVVAGLFGFIVWLAKVEIDREFAFYDIYFEDSVAGLGLGGDVRYRGIRVGTVTAIGIDEKNPGRVRITVRLSTEPPIREGDEAFLQLQGITGVSFVNIEGAGPQSPRLVAREGEPRAVIPSRPSAIGKLLVGAPELIAHALEVMQRFSALLNAENREAIGGILVDAKTLTGALAARENQFGRVLDSIEAVSADFAATAESVRSIVDKMDKTTDEANRTLRSVRSMVDGANSVVRDDVQGLVTELREMNREFRSVASNANAFVKENSEPLTAFAGDGLTQFTKFLNEASYLVSSMTRLTERLETEGARFLIGSKQSEYKVGRQ